MKLVSTISFECERIEGLQNRKQSERDGEGKGKASEFSHSMRDLSLDSARSQETTLLASATSHDAAKIDSNTSEIEELASAPANDKNLMEGFEIFGSLFSQLQVEGAKLVDDPGQEPSVLGARQWNGKPRSLLIPDALGSVLEGQDSAVVIDLATARSRTSAFPDMTGKGRDRVPAVLESATNAPFNRSALQSELILKEQVTFQSESAAQLRPKDGNPQSEDDVQISLPTGSTELQKAPINSNLQNASSNLSRVDQVVRFVVEESAAFSGTRLFASERHAHAGLTGKTLRLSLHPAELGGVEVSVSRRGKRLQVTIVPDLESTGRLLLKDSEQLVKRLGLASGATDYVQIQIATNNGAFEARTSDDHAQFSVRSERGRDSENEQHTSPQTSAADQQENDKGDKKLNSTRADISGRRVGGDIYL